MEKIDPAKAARVWERVQEKPDQRREQGLQELIFEEWTDAATYLQLSRKFQGKKAALLRKLYQDELSHAACLKGIYTLITGSRPVVKTLPPPQGDPGQILRRCYGREMRGLARYENRVDDPEYGQVFARLAQQEREHCHLILALLGDL